MLQLASPCSPVARARLLSINSDEATAVPWVVTVVTGERVPAHNLAWMRYLAESWGQDRPDVVLASASALGQPNAFSSLFPGSPTQVLSACSPNNLS